MKKVLSIVLFLHVFFSYAQAPWVFTNNFGRGFQMLESYDGGVVICAVAEGQAYTGKIIKLDQTGALLWEHTFEQGEEGLFPNCMVEDVNGDLIIAGSTFHYETSADAFIMRLNACGEVLWFKNVGEVNTIDWIEYMVLSDKGAVVVDQKISPDQRFTLKKINALGEVLWSSNLLLDNTWGGVAHGFSKCQDGGFMLTGSVYAPAYYDLSSFDGYLRGVVLKTDSLGSLEWGHVFRWEEDNADTVFISIAADAVELSNHQYNIVGVRHFVPFLKLQTYNLNENGTMFWHKNIAKPGLSYDITKSTLLPDSTIIVATSTHLPSSFDFYLEVYKIDLQGNILTEFVDQSASTVPSDLRLNSDSSFLYCLPGFLNMNLYALKFNPYTLELDSFAETDTGVYDYYCPDGVTELNYIFPELGMETPFVKEIPQLQIAPNPASSLTYFYFDVKSNYNKATVELRTLEGKLLHSYNLKASVGSIYQDVSGFSPGIYILSLVVDGLSVETVKLSVNN